jgi:WD40 repeat protein
MILLAIAATAFLNSEVSSAPPKPRLTLEQGAEVFSMRFSPDGRALLVEKLDGSIRLWDPVTGALKGTLPRELWGVSEIMPSRPAIRPVLGFSHDGSRSAVGDAAAASGAGPS